jgi:hypothetical protein
MRNGYRRLRFGTYLLSTSLLLLLASQHFIRAADRLQEIKQRGELRW